MALTAGIVTSLACGLVAIGQQLETSLEDQLHQTLQVDVDLVMVPVTVTDGSNRPVTGMDHDHFQVFEDKIQQDIISFAAEDAPVSVGIVFDVSGSMAGDIGLARAAATSFLRNGTAEDEVFLIVFNTKAELVQDFTSDPSAIQSTLMFEEVGGMTALYDAVYMGLEKLKDGVNPKKALLLITDGLDNRSRYHLNNVRDFVRESDVQIYSIGGGRQYGPRVLTEETGGRSFFPRSMYELPDITRNIAIELKNQYVIGYASSNKAIDGKWRDIDVRLDPPPGAPRLTSRARQGYYGPVR